MASKGETQVEAEVHGSGGKKKRLLLVVGVAVVILALGGGGAWFMVSGKPAAQGDAQARVKPKDEQPPLFVSLDPFVVNLAGEVEHYLQVGINLKVADSEVPEQIKVHLPEIRNAVLLLLSSKHAEDLATLEGKNRLRQEIRAAVNGPLGIRTPVPAAPLPAEAATGAAAVGAAHASPAPAPAGADADDGGVLDVLLTSFVIQ